MAKNSLGSSRTHANWDHATIKSEWEKFMSGTSSPPNVRAFMYNSWQRCMEQGVDPLLKKTSYSLGMEQIQQFVISDPLFRMVEPFLKKLRQLAENTGYLVSYANSAGELIYYDGDMSLMLKAEDICFSPGSEWSEARAGTNAIGTALITGVPVQVFAGEHFCEGIHGWTCSAAPIRDPGTGRVVGIIDLSGFWTANDPKSVHAVAAAAKSVEKLLYNQLIIDRCRLSHCFAEQTKRTALPIAVLDRGGRVIQASRLLYEEGWISTRQQFVRPPDVPLLFPAKGNWEADKDYRRWQFELTPYFYGGVAIGSIVHAIPPEIAAFRHLPDLRHIQAESTPLERDTTAENKPGTIPDPLYKSLFDHHPDAIFTYNLQRTLLNANPAAERLLGYDINELRRTPVPDLIIPNFRERALLAFAGAADGKLQEYEAALRHKQGHPIYVSIRSFPIIVDNEIVGVYETAKDTAPNYQQVQEDLKTTKEQLEFYFRNTEDAIIVLDTDLRVVKTNRSFESIYGWTEQELLGKQIPTVPDHLRSEVDQIRSSMLNARHAIPYETVRTRKDGSLIDVSNFASPLFDSKGNVVVFVVISRDITKQKQMEQLLRRTEKLAVIGQLAAGIAHEIRNPLTTLKGFIDLLKSKAAYTDNWYLDVMLSETEQIQWIASQFLAVAKPQSMKLEQKNVESMLRQAIALLNPLAAAHHVQMTVQREVDEPEPRIECDENQLLQLFINILKNAIEAMPCGGQIETAIRCNADSVSVLVRDHGEGIPQERIAHLGEPFYSLKEKGTGLGLMICYKIIEDHRGTIRITSEVGQGTTVEITLPFKLK